MPSSLKAGKIDIAWSTLGREEATRLNNVAGLTVYMVHAPRFRYLVFQTTMEK